MNRDCLKALAIGSVVSACAGSTPPIMTDEKFDSRQTDKGVTEFVYGISWRNTSQASLLRDGRQELERPPENKAFQAARSDRLAIQANNQTKLDLEDQAAEALKRRLLKEKLCAEGYEIKDVIWKAESIRLLGHCF